MVNLDFATSNPVDRNKLWKHLKNAESPWGQFYSNGKTVVSGAGAVGMSQLMPDTAKKVAEQNNIPWDLNRLYNDPAYNEKIGRLHFDELANKFNGDVPRILAAYNRGEGNLNNSLTKSKDLGINWRDIQPDETKKYINKILASYGADSSKEDTVLSMPPSPKMQNPDLSFVMSQNRDRLNRARVSNLIGNDTNDPVIPVESTPQQQNQEVMGPPSPPVQTVALDQNIPKPDEVAIEPQAEIQQMQTEEVQTAPPVATTQSIVSTGEVMGPPSPGSEPPVNPLAVPGSEISTTPYYESQGATQQGVRPNENAISQWMERTKQSALDGSLGALASMWQRWDAERDNEKYGVQKLTPEEANKRFPGLPTPFSEPVDPTVASLIHGEYQRRKTYQAWDARADEHSWPFSFSSSLVESIGNPVNVVLFGGLGIGAKALGATPGLGTVIGENLVGITALEQITRYNREKEHQPLTLGESLENIAFGTVAGTAFHYGLKYIGESWQNIRDQIKKQSPETVRTGFMRFFKGHESGQKASAAEMMFDQAKREAGMVPTGSGLEHKFVENPDLTRTPFYVSFKETGESVHVGDDLGTPTVIVDNPNSARAVTDSLPNKPGSMREVTVKSGKKFLSLDMPITELPKHVKDIGMIIPNQGTVGDFIRRVKVDEASGLLPKGSLDGLHSKIEKAGFSGYQDVVSYGGVDVSNRLHVLVPDDVNFGKQVEVDPTKIPRISTAEIQARQEKQNAPENQRSYAPEPKPEKFGEPTNGVPEQTLLEGDRARRVIDAEAKVDPKIKREIEAIDKLFEHETQAEKVLRNLTDLPAGESRTAIKEELAKAGVVGSDDMVDSLGGVLDELRSKSVDDVDFRKKATVYLKDTEGWAHKKKVQRQIFLSKHIEAMKTISQEVPGRSTFQKLYSYIIGGEKRIGTELNLNTKNMADGYETVHVNRLKTLWGPENLKIMEEGVIDKEVVHELHALENGGTQSKTGNARAYKIAKDFSMVAESLFSSKSGYNAFLEKIMNHIVKQTHARERVAADSFEDWVKFVEPRFGESSYPELSFEKRLEQYHRIYNEITNGTHGSSSFDREVGGSNIAYKMAKGRSLIPNSPDSFFEYNQKYGKGGLYTSLLDSIHASSRDIAVMSRFTATPKAHISSLLDRLMEDPAFKKEYTANEDQFKAAFAAAAFQYEAPALNMSARALIGSQKLITVAVNGAAYLASFADFVPSTLNIKNDFGGNFFSTFFDLFGSYWKNFAKGSKAAREVAEGYGIFTESALKNYHVEMGADTSTGTLGKMVELHSKVTLMQRHKAAMNAAMGELISNRLAKIAETPWGDLSPHEKSGMGRYGFTEQNHSVLQHGIEMINGRKALTPNAMLTALEKNHQLQAVVLGIDPKEIITLEKSPEVTSKSKSAYYDSTSPYIDKANKLAFERPEQGVHVGEISRGYTPESSAQVGKSVHEEFLKSGYSDGEAKIPSTLMATFFDSIGKATGKDPLELYNKYGFNVERLPKRFMDALGSLLPEYKSGEGTVTMTTMKGVIYDKTVIHEMSHFFLEVLRDVHPTLGEGDFKKGSQALFDWLGSNKEGNVTYGAHERFANSFEVFLRSNKAPTALESVFAMVRDWYRRALFMMKAGLSRTPFSLARPERAPIEVENFYRGLMGGEGATSHLGDLTSLMEILPQEDIAHVYNSVSDHTPLPAKATDFVLKVASLLNDHANMGTTSASMRDRVFMYRGTNVNDLSGQVLRTIWQFKSSALSQFNSMVRGFYSNPAKPNGDFGKISQYALMSMGLWVIQDAVKDILSGETPKDMKTAKYAMSVLIGSGAMGIIGDTVVRSVIMSHDETSSELALFKSLFPTIGVLGAGAMTAGRTLEAMFDPKTKIPSSDIGKQVVQNIPFQNLFYLKALMHYYFLNGISEFMQPGFLGKQERNAKRNGQEYFGFRPRESFQWLK